jgi:hypothetical protein
VRRLLVSLLLALALGACGGDDDATGPEESGPEGRWVLVSIDGDSVPVTFTGDSATVTVSSGFYNINNDHTFTYNFSYVVIRNGASTPQTAGGLGVWESNNDAIFFDYADGSFPDGGTIVGRMMYMTVGFSPYVYRRE